MELVGKSNPWSREWFCPRKNCVPCKGRLLLAAEDAEERLQMAEKKEGVVKRSQESRVAIPSCTGEGVNYILECAACRKSGKQVAYYGETSRSAFQRGAEHVQEIEDGILSHPLVLHFWEQHQGRRQEIMMRVTSTHLTALDRQITESVNILAGNSGSLNQKTEWGGAKIPSLLVKSPKGVARLVRSQEIEAEPNKEPQWLLEEAVKRGRKRLEYRKDLKKTPLMTRKRKILQKGARPSPRKRQ